MKVSEGLIKAIEENCLIDEIDGNLKCNLCGCLVIVDWFEQTISCQGCDEI
jgi:hypothetical protein